MDPELARRRIAFVVEVVSLLYILSMYNAPQNAADLTEAEFSSMSGLEKIIFVHLYVMIFLIDKLLAIYVVATFVWLLQELGVA